MRFSKNSIIHSLAIVIVAIVIQVWGGIVYAEPQASIMNSSIGVVVCFYVSLLLIPPPKPSILKRKQYPVLAILLGCYCVHIAVIAFMRIDYSRPVLLSGFGFTFAWLIIFRFFQVKHMKLTLHRFSSADPLRFASFSSIKLVDTTDTTQANDIKLGAVSDFHKPLNQNDSRLLAECSLHDIPIYHADLLIERLSRQVNTENLNPVSITLFSPSPTYIKVKYLLDSLLVIISTPISLSLAALTALVIKLDCIDEPILYRQKRMGYRGKIFTMYKFRTMCSSDDPDEFFATSELHRVNKLGHFLRKSRLDEIPQLFNVLKGEMSIIGPRPEQPGLAKSFQDNIPFYSYRHTVKPGITGWAQIEQGYTDSHEATSRKLGFDLYYIKNLNVNLDIYILLKTIKVVLFRKGV
ncbi:sugar transferase [Vibrio superstes]|uniref:Glycosyl transferase n=1 Tax=Vibrio superstes NBRC 103154 TaxID=1219062 RepID=A0A511QWG8_9VIBR|nr:sugar transferase [Vibrio superstes]GEM81327.1 glycosyl transferase [Vibrio superstes NBRC 103154]